MSDLSPLSGEERKSNFGAVRFVDDPKGEWARTAEDVQGLLDKLLGPMSTEDYGLADLMAAHDRLAMYQCLPILFPDAAREAALARISANEKSADDVADWVQMPPQLVHMILSENWPSLKEDLMNC